MVSRGTRIKAAGTVRQLALADFEHAAMYAGHLTVLRFPVDDANSLVKPGTFDGLDLETGRVRRTDGTAEIRARCTFESGQVRAVRVAPAFKATDLFWITPPGRKRADSEDTLEVVGVDAKRLQDCGDMDAQLMGAGYIARDPIKTDAPRKRWASRWDAKWPRTLPDRFRWHRNPWCWELRVVWHGDNVDWLLGHVMNQGAA